MSNKDKYNSISRSIYRKDLYKRDQKIKRLERNNEALRNTLSEEKKKYKILKWTLKMVREGKLE